MPYDKGYSHKMKGGNMKGGGAYGGKMGGSYGGKSGGYGGSGPYAGGSMDKMTSNPDSYRYSSPTARSGANRHGFSKNPKQSSAGRQTSNPFPKPPGWTAG